MSSPEEYVRRTHDFDPGELEAIRLGLTIPRFEPAEAIVKGLAHMGAKLKNVVRPFDLERAIARYDKATPAGAQWGGAAYTYWDTGPWPSYTAMSLMSYEEAHFWLTAYTTSSRFFEHRGTGRPSLNTLREQDYTAPMSMTQLANYLVAQNDELRKKLPAEEEFSLAYFATEIFYLVGAMWPRHEHLDVALALVRTGIFTTHNIQPLYSLFPVPRHEKDLAMLAPQAARLLEELDPGELYQARIMQLLARRYALASHYSRVIQDSYEVKDQVNENLLALYGHLPEAEQATFRKKYRASLTGKHLKAAFALGGWDVLEDWLEVGIARKGDAWMDEALCLHCPEAVKFFATVAVTGSRRPDAARWLHAEGANAIAGLIPLLAHHGHARDTAIDVLRDYKDRGEADLIEQVAESLDEETGKAQLRELVLDWQYYTKPHIVAEPPPEWLDTITKYDDELPAWLATTRLPAQFTKDGSHQLTSKQVESLVLLLEARGGTTTRTREIDTVRENLSHRELGQLAWSIFDAWLAHGADTRLKWAYLTVGHIGTAHEGQKVAPHLSIWPTQNKWRLAQEVLEIYGMIGSDGALMTLSGAARKIRQKSVKTRAQKLLEEIALSRGLTPEQLADRVVPDCDLDPMGRYTFDYGTRQFTLAFDHDLKPVLCDEKRGKIIKSLPKPGTNDDHEMAEEARETFKIMKKQIKEVISVQLPRLESAMVTERTWTGEEFEALFINHPVMTHFARRLLWGVLDERGEIEACFRVDEDNHTLDAKDDPFLIDAQDTILLVHPLRLDLTTSSTWGAVFGDYEIFPPFPQLDRPIHDLEPGEHGRRELTRFASLSIPGIAIKGFVQKSLLWQRGEAEDHGFIFVFHCHFERQHISCVVEMEQGFDGSRENWDGAGGLSAVVFYRGAGPTSMIYGDRREHGACQLEEVPRMVMSEVLKSLYELTSKYE